VFLQVHHEIFFAIDVRSAVIEALRVQPNPESVLLNGIVRAGPAAARLEGTITVIKQNRNGDVVVIGGGLSSLIEFSFDVRRRGPRRSMLFG
jgi:hypothetical protein